MEFETVIGLEIHAQINTKSKMFCSCSTDFGHTPNTNICPICLGYPGTLPTLNQKAVSYAIMAGLALNCQIQKHSVMARKNYFYPDLPKGYQITQFELPLVLNGFLELNLNQQKNKIGITRIHIEEDAGKLIHPEQTAFQQKNYSLVDLNRASIPLIEIVSEPDLRSAEEARMYMEKIHQLLVYLGICKGNLEQGNLRADANISLRPQGATKLGTRTEIKNLNSFKILEKAILAEVARQTELLTTGQKIRHQTLRFDEAQQKTFAIRTKEATHDYRYFPEPDLIHLNVTETQIQTIKNEMPLSLESKKEIYIQKYNLNEFESDFLLTNFDALQYFEKCLSLNTNHVPAREIAKWIVQDLNALIKESKHNFSTTTFKQKHLLILLDSLQQHKTTKNIAKTILKDAFQNNVSPETILQKQDSNTITDVQKINEQIQIVLEQNQDVVTKIKNGKPKSIDFLIGQTMKATKGQASPDIIRKIITEKLGL